MEKAELVDLKEVDEMMTGDGDGEGDQRKIDPEMETERLRLMSIKLTINMVRLYKSTIIKAKHFGSHCGEYD
ncbi:hypothetical protein CDL15_Pgr011615 [Punica granatum]|uniref:Uncharacterized protein n=1 Tax=Punica granatum TaxID=22663 RepID=A0A218XHI4_PUNGR|nr:hypothetical protein CDL15_Pgr011615 [Punica granatum]PKI61135.1 hypothetical protein CRG98_018455 [Punica granatum]